MCSLKNICNQIDVPGDKILEKHLNPVDSPLTSVFCLKNKFSSVFIVYCLITNKFGNNNKKTVFKSKNRFKLLMLQSN